MSLGHVALDGSKLKADASKHKATSYECLDPAEQKLTVQIQELLDRSEQEDHAEDERYGVGRRQFELPDELKHKESRLERFTQARARLEASARQARAESLRSNAAGLRERAEESFSSSPKVSNRQVS